jgi:hypothetical protein
MEKIIEEFLEENCTADENAEIKISELYDIFRKWFRSNYRISEPSRDQFTSVIYKKYQRYVDIKIKGIRLH